MKYLIVLDNQADVTYVQKTIKKHDRAAEIINSITGQDALRILRNQAIDIVLLDIDLLDSSGLELLAQVREKNLDVLILILINRRDINNLEKAFSLGADDFIVKSWGETEFIIRMRGAMGVRQELLARRQLEWEKKETELRLQGQLNILTSLSRSVDLNEAMELVLEEILRVTGVEAGAIRISRGEDYNYLVHRGFAENFIKSEFSLLPRTGIESCHGEAGSKRIECFCGLVIRGDDNLVPGLLSEHGSFYTGTGYQPAFDQLKKVIENPLEELKYFRGQCFQEGYETLTLIPINTDGETLGLLQLADTRRNALKTADLVFLEAIVRPLGLVFQHIQDQQVLRENEKNYRLLAESLEHHVQVIKAKNLALEELQEVINADLKKARQIMKHFLPKSLPALDWLSLAVYYRSARRVGGDFYQIQQVDEQLLVYLADVSGHGLDGAMLSIFVRETVNSYLNQMKQGHRHLSPKEVLEFLAERYAEEDFPGNYFISIFVGILDLKTGMITYSNAGIHIPPVLHKKTGETCRLTCCGLPISSVIDREYLTYDEETIPLLPGDTLLLCTDGLIEQEYETKAYGDSRLIGVFAKVSSLPPEIIREAIITDMNNFSHGQLAKDDITMLILQHQENKDKVLAFEVGSEYGFLKTARRKVKNVLEANMGNSSLLLLGFDEILANAMEHGNKLDQAAKINIEVINAANYLYISIEDNGKGFDWRAKINSEMEYEGERGRGIQLTKMCYDYVAYNEKGNKVYLVKMRQTNSVQN